MEKEIGGQIMTTINCLSKCTYQKNGNCTLQNIGTITSSASNDCAYFTQKNENDEVIVQNKMNNKSIK